MKTQIKTIGLQMQNTGPALSVTQKIDLFALVKNFASLFKN